MSSQRRKEFVKGMAKGAGALGVGLVSKLAMKVASGGSPTINLNAVNPLAGGGGFVGFLALAGGLAVSGNAEAGYAKDGKYKGLRKIVGYGLMAAVGASLDPDDIGTVPRQLTVDQGVAAQYAHWIPQYAPSPTFPVIQPTPPFAVITDIATQVPRYANVF